MKRFRFYAILLAMVTIVACSDDFEPLLIPDLETDAVEFAYEGGEQTFVLESNELWSVGDVPEWLTVKVIDAPETRAQSISYEKGKKAITITVKENPTYKERTAELKMVSVSGAMLKLEVTQEKKPELLGYWILSEGYSGSEDSELAWYDVNTKKLEQKQFLARNAHKLGDTGNGIKIYGSKMYVVITGKGFTPETTADNSYIEVIHPITGKSIKRIPFTDSKGMPAKPRNIIFEGGHGYISSYSNEVVRLDTATLTLDKHTALTGILPEGLTYNNGKIYVCNGGQGAGNNISVVDIETMKETKVITTAYNPNHIVTASNGDMYFNTDFPAYKLYKLTAANEAVTEVPGVSVADLAYSNNNIYTAYFDWNSFSGEVSQFNIATATATKLNLDLGSPEYHIGTINGSDLLYLTGQAGDNVIVFDPATKVIKDAFKTGIPGGSGLVAVYR